MRNSIGENVVLTLFGESHGNKIGAVLDGLPAGIKINLDKISEQLQRRMPNEFETSRHEKDNFEIVSGVFNDFTTGAPLTILIDNNDVDSSNYKENYGLARPSHLDYTTHVKFNGYEDYRGSGHYSGRITAAIVAIGSICQDILSKKNIYVGSHILQCGTLKDRKFNDVLSDIKMLNENNSYFLNDLKEEYASLLKLLKEKKDSIGGIIQTGIVGLPVGVGEPWFSSLEGVIANAVFSIGGVKGIEFGKGFEFSNTFGSLANDSYKMEDEKVVTLTNNNGGINGGISNGMPVVFQTAIKPTPSIGKIQNTIDFVKQTNAKIAIKGRHDPAIIRRICPVINNLISIILCDMLSINFGNNFLA